MKIVARPSNMTKSLAAICFLALPALAVAEKAWIVDSGQAAAEFGIKVSSAGDLNGDGYDDVVVGADEYDNGESGEGRIFVYLGASSGLSTTADWTFESDQTDARLGLGAASAGDVNGDGYSDLITGARSFDNVELHEGRAWVFYGNEGGNLTANTRLYESDLTTPLVDNSDPTGTQFGIGIFSKSYLGRIGGKLVWETVAEGNGFSGSPITNSTTSTDEQSSYTDMGVAGTELKNTVDIMSTRTKVRARIKYDPTQSIDGQVYSRWFYFKNVASAGIGVLPVELTNFTADEKEGTVILSWTTASELDNDFFTLERSKNGKNWQEVAKVNGAGTTNEANSYKYTDRLPLTGKSYYRLKQTDFNGRFGYSKMESVEIKIPLYNISIYPNPANDVIHIVSDEPVTKENIEVIDKTRSKIETPIYQQSSNVLKLNVSELPNDIYIIKVKSSSGIKVYKIIVSHP